MVLHPLALGHQSKTRCLRGHSLCMTRTPLTAGKTWPGLWAVSLLKKLKGTMIVWWRISCT
ncbi:hypothetical protein LINPERHAP1_LOCUS34491 [Linum perenne]